VISSLAELPTPGTIYWHDKNDLENGSRSRLDRSRATMSHDASLPGALCGETISDGGHYLSHSLYVSYGCHESTTLQCQTRTTIETVACPSDLGPQFRIFP
jgi:hypothetical protein